MKKSIRTNVKSGKPSGGATLANHNQSRKALVVRTSVKSGKPSGGATLSNHSQVLARRALA